MTGVVDFSKQIIMFIQKKTTPPYSAFAKSAAPPIRKRQDGYLISHTITPGFSLGMPINIISH
jgi:hypothetical protein